MGKSPKPLRIIITDAFMLEWHEVIALRDQGHIIMLTSDPDTTDIVLGPNCWRMDDTLRPFLDLAIKEARARAYPSK